MEDFIRKLTPALEERIRRNHSLNIDTFIIPSPFVKDDTLEKDYEHSYVWEEEGEILGYLLVYATPDRTRFHLYKQVTSPFGRGKGIGSAFIGRLVSEVPPGAQLYLFVWEKQQEATLFFANKGFVTEDRIVYRGLTFNHMVCRAKDVVNPGDGELTRPSVSEELGKTRHDARKTLRLLSDMVDKLSVDNCNRIIEDINRETTALVNMLNAYRDSVERFHEVNVKTLILERILPFIEMSPVRCEVRLVVRGRVPEAFGHYLDIGRALVNLASNALDAIRDSGKKGRITIRLEEREDAILLIFKDNGTGIEPSRLAEGPEGLPLFVGKTTKTGGRTVGAGQGIGTRQIFATFGKENIRVTSALGRGTEWHIMLAKKPPGDILALRMLEQRCREFEELTESPRSEDLRDRSVMGSFIWRLRKMEVLAWDLLLQFSKYNNIREIYRLALAFLHGIKGREKLAEDIERLRIDHPEIRAWLLDVLGLIREAEKVAAEHAGMADYGAILLKSYGQATDRTIIFTMDPDSGRFMATDRKLAEHVDFAVYLGKDRDSLVRGEFSGDVSDPARPLMLGVWSIKDEEDALRKAALVQKAARTLVGIGLKREKRLGFYQSTYVTASMDFNSYITTTLGEFAETPREGLEKFLVCTDDDVPAFVVTD